MASTAARTTLASVVRAVRASAEQQERALATLEGAFGVAAAEFEEERKVLKKEQKMFIEKCAAELARERTHLAQERAQLAQERCVFEERVKQHQLAMHDTAATDHLLREMKMTVEDARFVSGPATVASGREFGAGVQVGSRVFVVGGSAKHDGSEPLNSSEILNMDSMTVSAGPSAKSARYGCCAVQFPGTGTALIIGGTNFDFLNSTELLDVDAGRFVGAGPNMRSTRALACGIALDARRILVAGGLGRGGYRKSTEILDLDTMTWHAGPDMRVKRAAACFLQLDSRRALVCGGRDDGGRLATTEILDIDAMTFSRGPDLLKPRSGAAAVPLDGRRCLILGGATCTAMQRHPDDHDELATSEILDLEMMLFTRGPTMLEPRFGCCAAIRHDTLVVLGGCSAGSTTELLALSSHGHRTPKDGTTRIMMTHDENDDDDKRTTLDTTSISRPAKPLRRPRTASARSRPTMPGPPINRNAIFAALSKQHPMKKQPTALATPRPPTAPSSFQ